MSNTLETFTSSELETQLAELRTRREEFAAEAEKTGAELKEARSLIRLLKPKTLESATVLQSRFTVLTDTISELDAEITGMEAQLEAVLVAEQWARDEAKRVELQTALDQQATYLKNESLRVAAEMENDLRSLTADMRKSWEISAELHFLREKMGVVRGLLDVLHPFTEGNLHATLSDGGVNLSVILGLMDALQQLRFGDFVQSGINVTRESHAYRNAVEDCAMPPQPFVAGSYTLDIPELLAMRSQGK